MAKYCPRCKKKLFSKHFYKCPSRHDGLRAYCKKCDIEKNDTSARREYMKMYMRKRNGYGIKKKKSKFKFSDRKEYQRKYSKLRRVKDKEKIACRQIFHTALRNGEVTKKPCSICESEEFAEGHHIDYDKPLEVIWLCKKHHRKLHALSVSTKLLV